MKRLMISMLVIALTSSMIVNAAPVTSLKTTKQAILAQEKVEVKPDDLPQPVKATLGADPYSEWKVEKAYSVSNTDGVQYFEILLSKGEETTTVNLDRDGKRVE